MLSELRRSDPNRPQAETRALLLSLLGQRPADRGRVEAELIATEDRGSFVLESLVLHLNGMEPVPAYVTLPSKAEKKPYPVVLFDHSHGGRYTWGKRELLESAPYMQQVSYAEALAELGVAALSIDHWNFGERHNRTELEIFKEMLWNGMVYWGMMVHDSFRAIDYICQRPDLDSNRMATLGMSMGSNMAQWVAALDERIKACVDICCLTDYEELIRTECLNAHGIYYYVPGLLKHFTAGEVNALTAPRPHLGLAGNLDELTPPAGLDRIDEHLRVVYAACGVPEAWRLLRYDGVEHDETPEMRAAILEFLQQHLLA